MSGGTS
jgi:hypothetical protein